MLMLCCQTQIPLVISSLASGTPTPRDKNKNDEFPLGVPLPDSHHILPNLPPESLPSASNSPHPHVHSCPHLHPPHQSSHVSLHTLSQTAFPWCLLKRLLTVSKTFSTAPHPGRGLQPTVSGLPLVSGSLLQSQRVFITVLLHHFPFPRSPMVFTVL